MVCNRRANFIDHLPEFHQADVERRLKAHTRCPATRTPRRTASGYGSSGAAESECRSKSCRRSGRNLDVTSAGCAWVKRALAHNLLKLSKNKRRGWDSNPRWSYPHSGFRDRPVQPLQHLSERSGQRNYFTRPKAICGRFSGLLSGSFTLLLVCRH
jgi:hypothetical protein